MAWAGVAVHLRDRALDAMTGADPEQVLNTTAIREPEQVGAAGLSAALSRSLAALKRAAMDESGGLVDYGRLRSSSAYTIYRACVASVLPSMDPFRLRTREERLAFWINLYNALILDAVLAFGIERSVAEDGLGGLTFFRRAAYDVGGWRFSCDDIEHGVLRSNAGHPVILGPQWEAGDPRVALCVTPPEPRIHFALNCASRSCPPIASYEAANVDEQLELAARNFVAQEVAVDRRRGEVSLSSIFKWYESDFGGRQALLAFIACRLPDAEDADWLARPGSSPRLNFRPYDWALNRWL